MHTEMIFVCFASRANLQTKLLNVKHYFLFASLKLLHTDIDWWKTIQKVLHCCSAYT